METTQDQELQDLEPFQKHIADRFVHLSNNNNNNTNTSSESLLSIDWLQKLLDVYLCCESEFKAVLILRRDLSQFNKPPLDRLIPELLDRAVKALDICNAITHGIDSICQWQKLAEIAVAALEQKPLGEGQIRRAKKALSSLLKLMTMDNKEGHSNNSNSKATERAWSFGRRGGSGGSVVREQSTPKLGSVSLVVSKNWSAARQIQLMSSNLVLPRGGESSGLGLPVHIMSTVLVFVMWALITSIPCQDRAGLATQFPIPRQLLSAGPMIGLQERIAEEWKKKEKKGSAGLLDEMQRLEKYSQMFIELADSIQYPMEKEQIEEVGLVVAELKETITIMEEGLVPLQRQIREVFHRIVRSRTEVLELLGQPGKPSSLPGW
ncbi:hypothetical protein GIB67_037207 [Kingdonia uniflora]|uniref:Uncharacterized protein n=1 Tax=Kingdonia uniflora TaxID=39325 RepID=A0A7J7MRZ7_9MAGN|nr:hypothetical protein GIB67_037207 [Kingdonia uniflora]